MKNPAPWITGIIIFCVALYAYFGRSSSAEALAYQHDWSKARAEARAEKKPILLSFGGPWCPACVQLERTVFSDARIQKLSEEFICVKVDPRDPRGVEGAMELKSTRYVPEVRFLGPDGEVIEELKRGSAEKVAAQMEAILASVKKDSGR